jgi:hypothetical protein
LEYILRQPIASFSFQQGLIVPFLLQDLAYSPPYYPSPWATGEGEWAEAYRRAVDFVSNLTLAEKVNLTTGAGYVVYRNKTAHGIGLALTCYADGSKNTVSVRPVVSPGKLAKWIIHLR